MFPATSVGALVVAWASRCGLPSIQRQFTVFGFFPDKTLLGTFLATREKVFFPTLVYDLVQLLNKRGARGIAANIMDRLQNGPISSLESDPRSKAFPE